MMQAGDGALSTGGRIDAVVTTQLRPGRRMRRADRLAVLQWLTVLVPAVCAGLYETVRHSLLATELPNALGTLLAVALVLAISSVFARVSFGMIRQTEARLRERNRELQALSRQGSRRRWRNTYASSAIAWAWKPPSPPAASRPRPAGRTTWRPPRRCRCCASRRRRWPTCASTPAPRASSCSCGATRAGGAWPC